MKRSILALGVAGILNTLAAADAPPWVAPDDAARVVNPIPAAPTFIKAGKDIYTAQCVICHGATGKGDGVAAASLNPKPKDLSAITDESDGALFWKITTGRPPMLSFKDTLTDKERWEVVSYLHTLRK